MLSRRASTISLLAGFASTKSAKGQSLGSRALEGAWQVRITISSGTPPPGLTDFDTLIVFSGPTTIEHNGQPGFSPAMGEWSYAGKGAYDATWLKPVYNPQGQQIAIVKIRARIRMVSANEYTSEDAVEWFGANGTRLFAWNTTVKGTRIAVEPFE